MGRPKKSESGSIPTRERIIETAIQLFAQRSYDAVSVRDITKALNLNEASLYNHFKNKEDLLAAILQRLNDRLINPGFSTLPAEMFQSEGPFDLTEFLITGAKHFFSKADNDILLTWRILMMNQYRYESAYFSVKTHILNTPAGFFTDILKKLHDAGKIRKDTDCESIGRIIAAIFFDYSFRTNLEIAWENDIDEDKDFEKLKNDFQFIAAGIQT
ncbi:MAG: TetR/AcrR family transcriptional regulator [Spirochaetes bacterium]|nr:TetR/AcrR family transcriptional regulator [Spirochaetota bacterium]